MSRSYLYLRRSLPLLGLCSQCEKELAHASNYLKAVRHFVHFYRRLFLGRPITYMDINHIIDHDTTLMSKQYGGDQLVQLEQNKHNQNPVTTSPPTYAAMEDISTKKLKMPIPRSHGPISNPRGRVSRACDLCHASKSKCTGHQPKCQRCRTLQLNCWYPAGKRDEMRR
jgi:hypothetical protein